MKALSLTQPWATLIAIGAKRIETRRWSTNHRGRIAIHASKGFPRSCREFAYDDPAGAVLNAAGISLGGDCAALPRGAIVATAIIDQVWPTSGFWSRGSVKRIAAEHEYEFGDYEIGRFGWLLVDVRALQTSIPCKGALGLWTVPPDIEAQLTAALKATA